MNTYSDIKEFLNINIDKHLNDGFAKLNFSSNLSATSPMRFPLGDILENRNTVTIIQTKNEKNPYSININFSVFLHK